MKVAIHGVIEDSGKQQIEQAFAVENRIIEFACNPSKLDSKNSKLTIIQGQLSD